MRRPAFLLAALLLPAGHALAQSPAVPATSAPAPAPAQGGGAAIPPDTVVARVDGIEIRQADIEAEVRRLPDELRSVPPQMLQPLLLDQLITQKALVAAARAQGLDRDAEVQVRIRRAEEETPTAACGTTVATGNSRVTKRTTSGQTHSSLST